MQKKKILVVDDDPAICNLICSFFKYNNYNIEAAADGKTARQVFSEFKPDLVLLDVNLPDIRGIKLCQEMRKTGVLVVMLSCMNDINYILDAFEKGADDYLTKPFNLQLLKAKIEALFQRQILSNQFNDRPKQCLIFDRVVIDSQRREVSVDSELVTLTSLEFELLYFLASHPNQVWERNELILEVWKKFDEAGDERKVDIHIGHIRKKISDYDGRLIKTIWGKGYMFEPPITN